MMQTFAESNGVREIFAEASDVLEQDLWKLVAEGPADALNSTVNTQPVMLTAGYAVYRAWRDAGGAEPALVAGHSLGEYTALVAAGALAFRDALPLVRFRAQAMQEAVPMGEGAMAAILGLEDDAVQRCMRGSGAGAGGRTGQLQCAEPGRDCRSQAGSGAGHGGGKGERSQARGDAAGERALPFFTAQAGR